jgi:ABC-type glycerol-3-phosphate transport system substrate-binding protein
MFKGFQKSFEAKYPNVTVKPDAYDYQVASFMTMANAGNAPNIVQSWYTEPQKLIKNNMIADIEPEIKAIGWDNDMNPQIKALLTGSNGDLYGLPRDGYALGLMLNLNMFQKAGLMNKNGTAKYPTTWDQLAQDAVTIKNATGKAGFCLLAHDGSAGWHFSNIAWDFGAQLEVKDSSGKWTANFGSTQAVAAMQYVKDLKWKYNVLTSDPTAIDWAGGFTQLGTGNAAMLIAANDAVTNPTATDGLAVNELSLAPLPAGPGGQYALMGGTPYIFSKNSTPAQITACLNWIAAVGKAPVVNPDTQAAMEAVDAANVKDGTPNIYPFEAWTNQDYINAMDKAVDDNPNVNMALYNDYFDFVKKPGALHIEEPEDTQDMYTELTKVIQAVVTDKNANVQQQMNKASSDFNTELSEAQ